MPSYVLPMPTKRTIGSDMLAAVDRYLGAGNVCGARRAQELDQVSRLLGRAEPAHRYVALDDLRRAGRQDRRIDLAGCDRVDANAHGREVMRHLSRQRAERGLRRRVR